jgi:phosphatidylglycerol:prolipoprotein diacylglycerol transferase
MISTTIGKDILVFSISPLPRHPSQLYKAFMEGVVLLIVLWILRKKPFPHGMMIGLFITLYRALRFFLEFFREPDLQLGFIAGSLNMRQLLSACMIGAGLLLILLLRR